jgi:3-deoxy-manno-octulosonate cytidylyltransferase (CMP-KDO synthetase)
MIGKKALNDFIVVIPARYASTRLPGKPLRLIAGEPMIWHVHQLALQCGAQEVWIATDDQRIQEVALGFGANVCMTSPDHQSGTDRIAEVCDLNSWPDDTVVVNVQGDEPLLPPALIKQCADLLDSDGVGMATLASPFDSVSNIDNPNFAKVITNMHGNALYFSRAAIPYCRDDETTPNSGATALRHHGIYAYRRHVLRQLVAAGPCDLEQCEKLEQLRALWLGITLRVGQVRTAIARGVDTAEDLAIVEELIKSSRLHD